MPLHRFDRGVKDAVNCPPLSKISPVILLTCFDTAILWLVMLYMLYTAMSAQSQYVVKQPNFESPYGRREVEIECSVCSDIG